MSVTVYVVDYGRVNFYMRYTDPETGKEVARSTYRKSRKAAEKVAAQWEADINSGRVSPTGKTEWGIIRHRYEDQVLPGFKESTRTKIFTVLDRFEEFLSPAGSLSITTAAVSKFITLLRKEECSESTIAGYLRHLKSFFNWAADNGMLQNKPVFKKVQRAKKTSGTSPMKGRPLEDREFQEMLAACPEVIGKLRPRNGINRNPDDWIFYLRGMWLSGLRLEESLDLWWDRKDRLYFRDGLLCIPGEIEKGNRDRLLPLTPDFQAFLADVPVEGVTGRVFKVCPDFRTAKHTVSKIVSRIGKQAGIVVNSRSGKYASIHDFRRSFGERWAMRVTPQILMQLMRHENIETTMRYYVGRNALRIAEELKTRFGVDSGNTSGNNADEQKNDRDINTDWRTVYYT